MGHKSPRIWTNAPPEVSGRGFTKENTLLTALRLRWGLRP